MITGLPPVTLRVNFWPYIRWKLYDFIDFVCRWGEVLSTVVVIATVYDVFPQSCVCRVRSSFPSFPPVLVFLFFRLHSLVAFLISSRHDFLHLGARSVNSRGVWFPENRLVSVDFFFFCQQSEDRSLPLSAYTYNVRAHWVSHRYILSNVLFNACSERASRH